MFLALDIIVVVIFAATLINCIRKGFLVSVLNLLKSVLAVAAAYLFSPALADFFKNAFLSNAITAPVKNRLDVMIQRRRENSILKSFLPTSQKNFLISSADLA